MDRTLLQSVILFLTFDLLSAAHILGIPLLFRSHVLAVIRLSEQVQKYHGHTTTIILPEHFINESFVRESNLNYLIAKKYSTLDISGMENNMTMSGFEGGSDWTRVVFEDMRVMCDYLLTDTDLLTELRKQKFDIAVIDNFFNSPCISILAYKLSIPYIHFGRAVDMVLLRLPIPLTATVTYPLYEFSNPMPFVERLMNVFFYHAMELIPYSASAENAVALYAPEKPYLSKQEMKARAEIELIDYDILMDWPLPSLPNIVHVGGLTTKPANPLKGSLANFMNASYNGAIVVSFGSLATALPRHIITMLIGTFQKLKDINFVVKISNFTFAEDNVYSLSWLPQNDLLGHKNCKIFVTHCGNRGQFEALYHGVPMIGLPVFGDQHYNAYRMKMKGYGLHLDVSKVTSDQLVNAIQTLMVDPSYKNKITKASEIYKNRPQTPAERAAFWVDHTIKFRGEHLRTYPPNLPYYQYRLLDVYGFLLFCIMILVVILYTVTCRIVRCMTDTNKLKTE